MTDTIGVWVKKKFASGPFDSPPLANFRVNPLIAVEQNGKIRLVLNVSEPLGRSFNDNVDKFGVEKVYMSSAKDFGYVLCKAGVSANFSKFDLSDAYKNVPCKIFDLRLHGWENIFLRRSKFLEPFLQYPIMTFWATQLQMWQLFFQILLLSYLFED